MFHHLPPHFFCHIKKEEYDKQCKCPANEEPGQKSCNGCEPSCENPKPDVCTTKFCKCSCDCVKGMVRDSQTKKCVPKKNCPLKCPPGEQPGSKRCNKCEPTCDNPNARPCTKIGCTSCDCIQGIVLTLRNTKTNKCVAQQQCPKN
uniref:TIL domain-containing protein n=1 Tax=Globodera rostochiensis TaxID=31243 RepID=A0A914GQJ7_GLORO